MTLRRNVFASFLVFAPAVACGANETATPQPSVPVTLADPCRGAAFDADAPPPACMVKSEFLPKAPPREALAVRVLEIATVRSGEEAELTIELRNRTAAPLELDLAAGCLTWKPIARNAEHTTYDLRCGGVCGSPAKMLRVTLEPEGVVHKKISLRAAMVRIARPACKAEELGPLPPGRYTLSVRLPWSDVRSDEGHDRTEPRMFETPLDVTP